MNMAPKNCTFLIFLAYYDYTKSIVAQKKKAFHDDDDDVF